MSFVYMKILESRPERYDIGTGLLTLGTLTKIKQQIAERNAFNCECERHDLLARKMQGHDVCFAAVTRLRTFIKAIECADVIYGGHEQRR